MGEIPSTPPSTPADRATIGAPAVDAPAVDTGRRAALAEAVAAALPGAAAFVVDRDLRYVLAQGEALGAVGLGPEQLVGRTVHEVLDVLAPGLGSAAERLYRAALAGEEATHEHEQGGRAFLTRGVPLRGPDGAVEAALAVSYDVTERRAAEAAVRASEARYRALAMASADVLYRMSPDWGEMRQLDGRGFLSDTPASGVRASSGAWLGRYIHPDDQARVTAAIARAVRTQSPFALEHRVIRADGTLGWTQSRAVPLVGPDGTVTEWIGAASDVTPRKEAEAALRDSEAKYRTVFDSIDEGFNTLEVLYDAEGRPVDLHYLETNQAFERQTGLVDIVGRTAREVLPNLEDAWVEMHARAARTGAPERFERFNGDTGRWYDVYLSRVGGEGSAVVAAVFRDVTARKRAEVALQASEARQAFLLALSDALRPLQDPVAIQGEACRRLGERLGVGRAYYVEVDEAAGLARVERDWVSDGNGPSLVGEHPLVDFGWSVAILRRGACHVVADTQTSPVVSPAERPAAVALQIIACMGAPLIKDGRLVGALCVTAASPRTWTDAEVELLREVGERIWATVARARAEAALRASEARVRTLVEHARDYAIFLLDAEGRVTEWPVGAERVQGYTAAEAIGLSLAAFYPLEDRLAGVPARHLAEAAATGHGEWEGWRVRKDGTRFWANEIATAVHDAGGHLVGFTKISRDLTERRLAEQAAEQVQVAAARDELRRALAAAEEAEWRRLARELHDQLGQHLTGFALGLADTRRRLAVSLGAAATPDASLRSAEASLERLEELARLMTRDARNLALELRPPELDDVGLVSAIDTYVRAWGERTGVTAELVVTGLHEREVPAETGSALYRIVQEALTNVARHAGANHVSVIVEQPDGEVGLIVEDDGRGFDADLLDARAHRERRLGLAGMRERAALAGGTVAVESRPGAGTTVYARLPMHRASPSPERSPAVPSHPAESRANAEPGAKLDAELDAKANA